MDNNSGLIIFLIIVLIIMVFITHITIINTNPIKPIPVPVPTPSKLIGGCAGTQYGCCPNGRTARVNPGGTNC
jgi:hypothetical protein